MHCQKKAGYKASQEYDSMGGMLVREGERQGGR